MSAKTLSEHELEVPIYFLDRSDLWKTVKPYNLQYYPKEDFPRNNFQHSPCNTRVRSMRSRDPPMSLETEGFEVHELDTKMRYVDFEDETKIENTYCRELEKHFKETLGAKNVGALDYQLRRRVPEFPYFGGRLPPKPQPSLVAHVDVTPAAAKTIIHELYGEAAAEILKSRLQIITVWRALRVPVADWPLAICDTTSVRQADLVPADIIYPNYVAENRMVQYNEDQRWYWLPNQAANEVLVFKAVDTEDRTSSPCPHSAFPLPGNGAGAGLRESIDVRLLVMHADMVYPKAKPWSNQMKDYD